MKAKYELKVRGVLRGAWRDQREVTILNRRLRWEDVEITYEADPEHVRKLVEGIGLLADSNELGKPAVKEAVEDVGDPHWNEELWPTTPGTTDVFSNSDRAGCVRTWRSTSGDRRLSIGA